MTRPLQSLSELFGERGTKLIDLKKRIGVVGYSSLYLGLFITIAVGLVCSILTYSGTRKLAREAINEYYNTEENRLEREEAYFNSLQNFQYVKGIYLLRK